MIQIPAPTNYLCIKENNSWKLVYIIRSTFAEYDNINDQ